MSPLLVLLVVVSAAALPYASHDDHHDDHDHDDDYHDDHDHDDDDMEELIMVQCLSENGDNSGNLMPCLQCFGEVDDIEEKKGLDEAKACVAKFLPQTQQACSKILDGMTAGDDEKGEEVLDCFHNTVLKMEAKKCLDKTGDNSAMVDSFTEAALCMLDAMHNATKFVKTMKMVEGGGRGHQHDHGRRGRQLHHQLKQSMKLVPAHCHQAIGHDQNKLMVCEDCFHSAIHSGQTQVLSRLADCSTNHLHPVYETCTQALKEINNNQQNTINVVKDCYIRTLTRNLVEDCSTGKEMTSSVEDFIEVFECGHEKVEEYMDEEEDDN